MFSVRNCGKTFVTRTQGTKIASDALKGRVFEISLGDLNNDEDQTYRKIKLICEDVQGYNCLTNFHGMGMTRDKLASLIKKWQTLVEGNVDVKTTDGYTLRMFAIGFTTKMPNQVSKMCYANSAQVRQIRKKMVDVMREEASKCDLKDLVLKLIPEYMGGEIEKACAGIFPMQNVFVRKVKVLKKPKFDLVKLMELHSGEGAEDSGDKAEGDAEEVVAAEKDITQAASGGRLSAAGERHSVARCSVFFATASLRRAQSRRVRLRASRRRRRVDASIGCGYFLQSRARAACVARSTRNPAPGCRSMAPRKKDKAKVAARKHKRAGKDVLREIYDMCPEAGSGEAGVTQNGKEFKVLSRKLISLPESIGTLEGLEALNLSVLATA